MTPPCTGVILSGGLSTRMGGKPKAFLKIDGEPILDRLYRTMKACFEGLTLVTNTPYEYLAWDLAIVTDLIPVRSALTGIHAGLFHAPSQYIFVTACDMPFVKSKVVNCLLDALEPKWDVVIPATQEGRQPLCALYSKRCLRPIERQLKTRDPRIVTFFPTVRVKEVPESTIRAVDPQLHSFFNINTPEDLKEARKITGDSRSR
ncbi:MAG: molybdenum cofactor guanylyltransferase [Deltaproteobacteria bacterium]|nr:molybdenum cofactor guanylyltransferase [Deltaproteobacteria bacterium]